MTCPNCPDSFDAGAEAMRARILAGIRCWWSTAGKVAGHRFPGHPHWLDCAVAGIDVASLRRPVDPGPSAAPPR